MRIYLHLSPNKHRIVPFDYHENLTGAFHRWLKANTLHDELSLYSVSWLEHGIPRHDGLHFPSGSTFFISASDASLISSLIEGVQQGHQVAWGMEVESMTLRETPDFGSRHRFLVQSPVLIKRNREDQKGQQFYYHHNEESDGLLTETLKQKMKAAGLEGDVSVQFDRTYASPRIKMSTYRGIKNKGSVCPVIISGDPRAVAFAWEVGIGNSTGIGFGALK